MPDEIASTQRDFKSSDGERSHRWLPWVLVGAVVAIVSGAFVVVTSDDDNATDPPATDPPATDPPATDPPATDPPATDPPATDPPATDPPATDPPATGEPRAGTAVIDGEVYSIVKSCWSVPFEPNHGGYQVETFLLESDSALDRPIVERWFDEGLSGVRLLFPLYGPSASAMDPDIGAAGTPFAITLDDVEGGGPPVELSLTPEPTGPADCPDTAVLITTDPASADEQQQSWPLVDICFDQIPVPVSGDRFNVNFMIGGASTTFRQEGDRSELYLREPGEDRLYGAVEGSIERVDAEDMTFISADMVVVGDAGGREVLPDDGGPRRLELTITGQGAASRGCPPFMLPEPAEVQQGTDEQQP